MRQEQPHQPEIPCLCRADLERYRLRHEWFLRSHHGIHGAAHETRVLVLAQLIAAMERRCGMVVDVDVIGWAAVVHDTQRQHDGIDAQHGARAAAWVRQNSELLPSPNLVEPVAHLCEWHAPSDEYAPEMRAELRVFKDADGLDRWRIGDLDPAYLRTASALRLYCASGDLWSRTRTAYTAPDPFTEVLDAAEHLKLLSTS